MRELKLVVVFLLVAITFVACTKDQVDDNEQVEFFSPNVKKITPPGGN